MTETVFRSGYQVDADRPESARAIFGPNAHIEDDGSVLDESGQEMLTPFYGESVTEVMECRLDSEG